MKAITYSAARQNLAKTMENVCKDHAPIIVTRKTTDSVVIISLEDYEALEETAYLLRSPKNTIMHGMIIFIGKRPIKKSADE